MSHSLKIGEAPLDITAEEAAAVSREMPRYKCHKEVWALKIKEVDAEKQMIVPADEGYGTFFVKRELFARGTPKPGDYYVVYGDGYASFSPAKAFEDGYALIR